MQCLYCKETTINYEMYVVRKAVKPKGAHKRWEKIGLCCEECFDKGKPIEIVEGE